MNALLPALLAVGMGGAPEWKPVAPKDAGFRVSLPAQPEENKQTIKAAQGSITIRSFTLAVKDGTYAVGVTEHAEAAVPAGQDQARLDQARDGAVQHAKGRLRGETKITVEGRSGREILITTETGQSLKIRLIADRNRLYQVMAVGGNRFLESPEATRFLESFRFAK